MTEDQTTNMPNMAALAASRSEAWRRAEIAEREKYSRMANHILGSEQAIQVAGADKAPRITPADIEANIESEHYFTAKDGVFGASIQDGQVAVIPAGAREKPTGPLQLVTICVLILKNGTKVVGVNEGPVSPENFNAELGRQYARKTAVDQIWPMLGYELRSKLAGGAL